MMTKRSEILDLNRLAATIVAEATGKAEPFQPKSTKNITAQKSGRLGGLRGGKARAEKLTSEQRTEIAKRAAQKRWYNVKQSEAEALKAPLPKRHRIVV